LELREQNMARLAFYTFGILREPLGSEVVRPFVESSPKVFAAAEAAPGFIARAVTPAPGRPSFGQDYRAWGIFAVPRFYDGGSGSDNTTGVATLTLWTGIGAVRAFAYAGQHKVALGQRWEWFRKGKWPTYVMWWVGEGDIPTWEQGARNLEMLGDIGPTETAFNFRKPFDADGTPLPGA
jgi:hypothetical protein